MNDEKLLRALRRGDEGAIDTLMRRYARLLWSVASAVLGDAASEADIEECVADVFVRLWREPEKYDPDRGSLRSWLCLVTRCRAVDRLRELTRRGEAPLDETLPAREPDLDDLLAGEEAKRQLAAAVDALDERDREILLRRYCREQKPKEIALALGVPVKQVENRLYRSKQALRRALSDKIGGIP